jgi:lysophospholipase L1-like esterase
VIAMRAAGRLALLVIVVALTLAMLVPLAAIAVTTFDRPAYRLSTTTNARGPLTLLVLGDSLGSGYRASSNASFVARLGAKLRAARPGSRTYNMSEPGAHIGDLQRQLLKAPVTKADAVLLVAGGNDVRGLTEPITLALQERALLDRIHARFPGAAVIVSTVPDVSRSMFHIPLGHGRVRLWSSFRFPIRAIVAFDDSLVERLARNRNAAILDFLSLSRQPDADEPAFISSDGLHPNDAGHARIAAYAWPIVATALRVKP